MVTAVDPTYPLYPIACILAATMLLLVLLTSFIRQNWNLGVAFLCFWLFLETLVLGINAILWADNADIKLYVYCDIVSHLELITAVVKPMATLIITRRLYLVTHHQWIEPSTQRRNQYIEWTLGLVIPVLVAGPLYYVVQASRFVVEEGFGCGNAGDGSILNILLIWSWTVIPPTLSIVFYYPRIVQVFYRMCRNNELFSDSYGESISHLNYIRILALASIDVLLTLPAGIVTIALAVSRSRSQPDGPLFYLGWTVDHTHWDPVGYSYTDITSTGISSVAQLYFSQWTSPFLAFVIFGLFGVTSEARTSYWTAICTVGGWLGWKPTLCTRMAVSSLGDIEFVKQPQEIMFDLVETGSHPSDSTAEARGQEGVIMSSTAPGQRFTHSERQRSQADPSAMQGA